MTSQRNKSIFGEVCAVLVAMLAIALTVAGCGGTSELTKAEFIKQGDAICVKSNTKTGTAILAAYKRPEFVNVKSQPGAIDLEVTLFMPIVIKDAKAQLNGIRSLEPPSEDEASIKEILDAYEAWIEKAEATPLQLVISSDTFENARRLAGTYGLTKCGDSPYEEPYVHN